MNSRIGVDMIDINDFRARLNRTETFIHNLLSLDEIEDYSITTLAGKVAAKEAIMKTGAILHTEWLKIKIKSDESGKPYVTNRIGKTIEGLEISISHTQQSAVAVAIYEKP